MSVSELQATIDKLCAIYGERKCNLIHPTQEREGVWVVPADAHSFKLWEDDASIGEKGTAYLLNQPLGWAGKNWGDLITFTTQANNRPIAIIEDQLKARSQPTGGEHE